MIRSDNYEPGFKIRTLECLVITVDGEIATAVVFKFRLGPDCFIADEDIPVLIQAGNGFSSLKGFFFCDLFDSCRERRGVAGTKM